MPSREIECLGWHRLLDGDEGQEVDWRIYVRVRFWGEFQWGARIGDEKQVSVQSSGSEQQVARDLADLGIVRHDFWEVSNLCPEFRRLAALLPDRFEALEISEIQRRLLARVGVRGARAGDAARGQPNE